MTDRKEEPIGQVASENPMQAFRRAGSITVYVDDFDYLIGKLFTHTELLGLPERQHAAYKSTVRTMFWGWYNAFMQNETGLSDPSYQHRVDAGVEKEQ